MSLGLCQQLLSRRALLSRLMGQGTETVPRLGTVSPQQVPTTPPGSGWLADSPHQRREVLSPDCPLSGPPTPGRSPLSSPTRVVRSIRQAQTPPQAPPGRPWPSAAESQAQLDSPVALQPHLLSQRGC